MAPQSKHPLLVICGPTASGKSELAMKVAERFNGEIICADSRTVYKGVDIGTAKPTQQDQQKIPHHLLDQVEPGKRFTVYDFQKQTQVAIDAIQARDKLPIMTGGTGLYIDSVIFNYKFPPIVDSARDTQNQRHAAKIEGTGGNKLQKNKQPLLNTIIVGITTNIEDLEVKIAKRAEYIFSHGVVDEAKKLGEMYGWDNESMTANIYPLLRQLINGELTKDEAIEKSILLDRQLAKRQMTWLKRHSFIQWYSLEEAEKYLFSLLAKT